MPYGDIVEKALYNGILSGVSLDGKRYFYMNPLEVWPERCERRQDLHIDAERQGWFGCACCPPNVLRTLTGLGNYLFACEKNALYIDQYISSTAHAILEDGYLDFKLTSALPWGGEVRLKVLAASGHCRMALRIPGWAREWTLRMNGEELPCETVAGYAVIERAFKKDDELELTLSMEVRMMRAAMYTPNYAGRRAIMKGPLVYCLEEIDNGDKLWNLYFGSGKPWVKHCDQLLGGVDIIQMNGFRETTSAELYSEDTVSSEPVTLTFVPYYAWGNRGKGEMTVWVRKN